MKINSSQLAAAEEALGHILTMTQPADAVLSRYFRAHPQLGQHDRAFIAETIFGVLRRRYGLEHHTGVATPRRLLLAYLNRVQGVSLRQLEPLLGRDDAQWAAALKSTPDAAPASSEQGSRLRDANVRESGAAPSSAGVASVSGVTSPKGARRRAEEGPLWGSDPEGARRAGVDAPMAGSTVASPQVGPLLRVTPAPVPPSDGAPREVAALTPAATQQPVAVTPVVAVTAERRGMFLQLGAFGSQDNADNYLARLRAQVDWLAPALHVYLQDGLFRVHAGPYANQAEARTAAERISQALGIKTMALVR